MHLKRMMRLHMNEAFAFVQQLYIIVNLGL
jgi:hypothetical protein